MSEEEQREMIEIINRISVHREQLLNCLHQIIDNAPTEEPTRIEPRTLPQAHSYWQAGKIAQMYVTAIEADMLKASDNAPHTD